MTVEDESKSETDVKTTARRHRGKRLLLVAVPMLAFLAGALAVAGSIRHPAGEATGEGLSQPPLRQRLSGPIRLATFNIHSGRGKTGGEDLDATAAELKGCDVAALNEVRGAATWGGEGQAARLADRLGLPYVFAPTERRWFRDDFGNALVCSLPVRRWHRIPLVGTRGGGYRNVLVVELGDSRRSLHVAVTHVAVANADNKSDHDDQLRQVGKIFADLPAPAVLMGDFNTNINAPTLAPIRDLPGVVDAAGGAPGDYPGRKDFIWVRGAKVSSALVRPTTASDHPIVLAEIELPEP